jgi:hypothetical protein
MKSIHRKSQCQASLEMSPSEVPRGRAKFVPASVQFKKETSGALRCKRHRQRQHLDFSLVCFLFSEYIRS